MLKNYLKIALRYFWRNKIYTFIHVFGLAIALTTCILLILFVQDEYSFDKFHPRYLHIYQIYNQRINQTYPNQVSHKLAPILAQKVKGIRSVVRTFELGRFIKIKDKKFNVTIQAFDANFGEIFNFKLLKGNLKTALSEYNSVILSERKAREYFGNLNIMNHKILLESDLTFGWDTLQITGIIEDCPANSSIAYDIIIPFDRFAREMELKQALNSFSYPWLYNASTSFVLLDPSYDKQSTAEKIEEIYQQNIAIDSSLYLKNEGERYDPSHRAIQLLPLRDIHLNKFQRSNESAVIRKKSHWLYSYVFGTIALVILLVACFNFTNLSLMQYLGRSREIGLRKVIGASQRHLVFQFYVEAFLLCIIAFVLAVILCYWSLPALNSLINKELIFNWQKIYQIFPWLLSLIIVSTLLAGFYPALVFAGFQPIEVLKGIPKFAHQNRFSTNLVVLQFAAGVTFIALMLIMNFQLNFILKKSSSAGRQINDVVEVYSKNSNQILDNIHLNLKKEIAKIDGVKNICLMFTNARGRLIEGKINQLKLHNTLFNCIENDYIATLQMKILEGKGFDQLSNVNKLQHPVLVNEYFVRAYQLKYPLGQIIELNNLPEYKFVIWGVVQDYVQNLYAKNQAEILIYNNPQEPIDLYPFNQFYNLTLRIEPKKDSSIFAKMDKIFADFNQIETGVNQIYLDTYIQENLEKSLILPGIITHSAILPILIALMGLISMASFNVNQRTKEIGIRKTLGASERAIVFLLVYQFQKLVLKGILIALPLICWISYQWTQTFAFRISWGFIVALILLSCFSVIFLSTITMILLVFRKAQANPVDSLRFE